MRRPALLLAAVAAAALLLGLALVGYDRLGDDAPAVLVDEERGAYGRIRLGADAQEVTRVFGASGDGPGIAPLGADSYGDIGAPPSIPAPCGPGGALKYDEVTFLACAGTGVYAFIVIDRDAETTRGVGIGDDLAKARETYDVTCSEGVAGERIFGGTDSFPYCHTRTKRPRVYFGEDPIASITVVDLGAGS